MKTLLLTTALAALCLSSACAGSNRSASSGGAEFPKYDSRVAEAPAIKPIGVAQKSQAMTAAPADAPAEKSYAESFDPSGWNGPSTPPNGAAIGGGPKAEALTDDNPYETDGQKPQQQEKELTPSTP